MAGAHSLGSADSTHVRVRPELASSPGAHDVEDRRKHRRRLPRRPTKITLHHGTQPQTAFTRDVSSGGIGLMHPYPVERGEIVLEIAAGGEPPLRVRAEITWCLPCRDGWYQSGARLLGDWSADTCRG